MEYNTEVLEQVNTGLDVSTAQTDSEQMESQGGYIICMLFYR